MDIGLIKFLQKKDVIFFQLILSFLDEVIILQGFS